jgi:16S rRNA (guanine1207-N2)-methyltransferase
VRRQPASLRTLIHPIADRLATPALVALGSPREAAEAAGLFPTGDVRCLQMDLYQAHRLERELADAGSGARVVTAADLWELPAEFQTVVYPAPRGGERELKLDVVEQAYHVLKPAGVFVVVSPYEADRLFPAQLKKVFGRFHQPEGTEARTVWARRQEDRPRRRHEVTFQAKVGPEGPLPFVTRPGTFAYGRFDEGAWALIETMAVNPGDRVLDLGCGCGTNGVFAGRRAGPTGHVTFVDSNLRAIALAERNARENAVPAFKIVATADPATLPAKSFDAILANPPYHAEGSIARMFIEKSARLLREDGRFYLVSRQPETVGPMIVATFGGAEAFVRRNYHVFEAPVR